MGTITGIRVNVAGGQRDTTAPNQIAVNDSGFGVFSSSAQAASCDPLYVQLGNIEAGTTIEVLNRSSNPAAEWGKDSCVLAGSTDNPLNGQLSLMLSDQEAAKAGIVAGDQFFIRQTDCAGNASEPALVSLSQRQARYIALAPDTQFIDVTGLAPGSNLFTPATDARAPIALFDRVSIDVGETAGVATLKANQAVEPFAEVEVVNTRTQERVCAQADITGCFNFDVPAEVGDTLSLSVTDHNGNESQLGTVKLGECGCPNEGQQTTSN